MRVVVLLMAIIVVTVTPVKAVVDYTVDPNSIQCSATGTARLMLRDQIPHMVVNPGPRELI